jgi:hypothetical protein
MSALLFFVGVQPIFAAPPKVQEVRMQIIEQKKEIIAEKKASLSAMKKNILTKAALVKVTVVSKGTTSFVAQNNDGKEYTILFDSSTQWRRKFWGKSDVGELSVGDELNVYGKWTNEEMTSIQAKLIRNISIQKRHGVFFGSISSLQSSGFIMATLKRGNQTVTISGGRLVDRTGNSIAQSALLVGHRVRIKGLWDNKNNTITEVTEVKDFDLPAKPTVTSQP